jgi:ATP-dependent DNA helicase RecQ
MYGGELFTDLQQVSEADLAKNYFVPVSEISTMLDFLQNQKIITYLKQGFLPTITFLTPRYDAKLLPIQERRLDQLKKRELTKANSMINYASTTNKCRSNLILQYFNEIPELGCGVCDYCVSQKRKKNSNPVEFENYKNQILILLENVHQMNPEALKNTLLPQKEKVFIGAIEFLLENDQIRYNASGELELKK